MLFTSAHELIKKLNGKEISAVELCRETLKTIGTRDPHYNSFLHIAGEKALEQAKQADKIRKNQDPTHPLCGCPQRPVLYKKHSHNMRFTHVRKLYTTLQCNLSSKAGPKQHRYQQPE